ncbi:MAG: hypothetical protein FJW95_08080 [Actinobacteria bacterium]|nr:hypothetical protein [Actinomycetota bacterium]
MRLRPGVLVVAAAVTVGTVGLTACGGGDDRPRGSSRGSGTTETTATGAGAYVGLSKRAAIAKADASDTPWRITREDDESFMVTQDYVPERLNFEIDDGTVTTAAYG